MEMAKCDQLFRLAAFFRSIAFNWILSPLEGQGDPDHLQACIDQQDADSGRPRQAVDQRHQDFDPCRGGEGEALRRGEDFEPDQHREDQESNSEQDEDVTNHDL